MSARRRGFRRAMTLLEVLIAVAIIGLIGIGIYRFILANMQVINLANEQSAQQESLRGVAAYVQEQLLALPPKQTGALVGQAHVLKEKPSDELRWLAEPGSGMLTRHAEGNYNVTFTLRTDEKTGRLELGLRRLPADNSSTEASWFPLLGDVRALEIRYYDPRLSSWLENWTDLQSRPALVRLRIWRGDAEFPYEAVLSLPRLGPA